LRFGASRVALYRYCGHGGAIMPHTVLSAPLSAAGGRAGVPGGSSPSRDLAQQHISSPWCTRGPSETLPPCQRILSHVPRIPNTCKIGVA